MTDARFPERLLSDRRVLRLSAEEYRGWSIATIWSVSNRTDGLILVEDLPLVPFMTTAIAEKLETAGLWAKAPGGWQLADFHRDQTSRSDLEVLERARKADREKKQRQRSQKKESRGLSPGHVPGTAQARTGQARTGQDGQEENPVTDWKTASIPETDPHPDVAAPGMSPPPVADLPRCVVCERRLSPSSTDLICSVQDEAHWAHEASHAI